MILILHYSSTCANKRMNENKFYINQSLSISYFLLFIILNPINMLWNYVLN